MMDSWRRELRGVQSGPEWEAGSRGGPKEELDLTNMDTLIMQVSKMSRSVAEVRESCLCKYIVCIDIANTVKNIVIATF